MEINRRIPNCAELNQKDIVEYLKSVGIREANILKGYEYWYHSPISGSDKTPSFRVDTRTNRWKDFSTDMGGSLVDLGIILKNCSVSQFLREFENPFILPKHVPADPSKHKGLESTNEILGVKSLVSYPLISYLASRGISKSVADKYCKEVTYRNSKGQFYSIGFENRSGGFELRNQNFKGASSPKDITHINNGASEVSVFEGFFSFLSFIMLNPSMDHSKKDYVILNSLTLFEKAKPVMEKYEKAKLYLDQDEKGIEKTAYATKLNSRYQDFSGFYAGYKDANKFLLNEPTEQVKDQKNKMSLA